MNRRYIVGIAIIIVCSAVGFSAFRGSLTPYVSFAEAQTLDRACQVMGRIDKEKVRYDHPAGTLHFTIIDDLGHELPVAYKGVTPGNFDQANSVVAQGRFETGIFQANHLLVKCPSKYQGLAEEGYAIPHESKPDSAAY